MEIFIKDISDYNSKCGNFYYNKIPEITRNQDSLTQELKESTTISNNLSRINKVNNINDNIFHNTYFVKQSNSKNRCVKCKQLKESTTYDPYCVSCSW